MNRNSFLGLIGITLLVFGAAYLVGKWTRASGPAMTIVSAATAGTSDLPELTSNNLQTAVQAEAAEEQEVAPPVQPRVAPVSTTKSSKKKPYIKPAFRRKPGAKPVRRPRSPKRAAPPAPVAAPDTEATEASILEELKPQPPATSTEK